MRLSVLMPVLLLATSLNCYAGKGNKDKSKPDSLALAQQAYLKFADSVVNAMKYETGHIVLKGGNATLNVPEGFKFLNAQQSEFVLTEIWGNPKSTDVLGMIFPADGNPYQDSSYVFVVSFEDMGYVKDHDAEDIDYDKMMKEMQTDEVEVNKTRTQQGYSTIHINGWAQKPFYDKNKKVLHWAKDLAFGDKENHTLNYDVRVLGRNGVLSLNAVASMNELPMVKKDIDKVLNMASFSDGNKYSDFNSSTDKIAVYTIGGLVAGKVLAKVGLFALIAKFGKIIIAALIAAFYAIRKWLTGRGKPEKEEVAENLPVEEEKEA